MEIYEITRKKEKNCIEFNNKKSKISGWKVFYRKKNLKRFKFIKKQFKNTFLKIKNKIHPNLYKKNIKNINEKKIKLLQDRFKQDKLKIKYLRSQRKFIKKII
jgi:ribosomal protein L31E